MFALPLDIQALVYQYLDLSLDEHLLALITEEKERDYILKRWLTPDFKTRICKNWYETTYKDKLHSVGDQPAYKSKTASKWYKLGSLHRLTGPAIIRYDHTGKVVSQEYRYNGAIHRTDGPAYITQNTIEYYHHGKLHHTGGPARITANAHEYRRYGKLHREDGPAYIMFDTNGNILTEFWYLHGLKHRRGPDPAVTTVKNGRPVYEYWRGGLKWR